ncbi:hypothetical protein CRG98_020324 [Punica granatum]|uniref:Retrotransposon gag domain-containing protein n=1 Tax=Punica granatum TaxID=22663 RepID=A0A2I0JSH0_PUNGR|nr:hypothetical protein CRG98_020324 [Punica granatum]
MDPGHHIRHYQGKMLQYWKYEKFIIHKFQDSLTGPALNWFMSLRAADILTLTDLFRKFIDQYQYCAETPSFLLELSTVEMVPKFQGLCRQVVCSSGEAYSPISEKLDMGIKLGRIKGQTRRERSSKKTTVGASSTSGKKGKEASINVVNPGRWAPQRYSMNFALAPPAAQMYASLLCSINSSSWPQLVYHSAPPTLIPSSALQQYVRHYALAPPQA